MQAITRREMLLLLAGAGAALTGCEDEFNLFNLVGPPAGAEAPPGGLYLKDRYISGDAAPVIDAALQECADSGVRDLIIDGRYPLESTVHLRSNVNLYLAEGAKLDARDTLKYDLPEENPTALITQDRPHSYLRNAVIYGGNVNHVKIYGPGRIEADVERTADKLLVFDRSSDITVEGITLEGGAHIIVILKDVVGFELRNLAITSGSDGINIADCQSGQIINCTIQSWNDSICFKSYPSPGTQEIRGNRDIQVLGGNLYSSDRSAVKFGRRESYGPSEAITIRDVHVWKAGRAAFALKSHHGSQYRNILCENMIIEKATIPIYMYVASAAPQGMISNISIERMRTTRGGVLQYPIYIAGDASGWIDEITLRDVQLNLRGGFEGTVHLPNTVFQVTPWVEGHTGHSCPAKALFAAHVNRLNIIKPAFTYNRRDARPDAALYDVTADTWEPANPQGIIIQRYSAWP